MTETAATIYTSGEYAERHPTWHAEDSAWKVGHIVAMMRRHGLEPETVCEVGCGAGENLGELQKRLPDGVELHGYEISPQGAELCRKHANPRLHFRCEDLLASEAGPFDLVLCIDVFEHVPDYLGFLEALRRYGRQFIFHIPLDLSVQSVLRGSPIRSTRREFGHLHYFTRDTALATLTDSGYEVVDWAYTPVGAECGRGFRSALARWPRRLLGAISRDFAARLLGGYSLLVVAR
jgi:cyclopropane fatty-acyl-phospholipid synthase-like methyltransferase